MRRSTFAFAALLSLAVACGGGEPVLDLTERLAPGEVRAGIIDDEAQLIGGPKADGRIGDVKMFNSQAAFIIEGARRASGYRYWGGNLVDADVIRPEGESGQDLFGEIFFAWNLMVFAPDTIEVVNDGLDGNRAHTRVTGKTGPFLWAESFLSDIFDADSAELEVVHDYYLEPDSRQVRIDITLTNPTADDFYLNLPIVFASNGDGANPYAPNVGFEGLANSPRLPYLAAAGRALSYAMITLDDDLTLLYDYKAVVLVMMDTFTLPPGGSLSLEYYFVVTEDGPAGLDAARNELFGYEPGARLAGTVDIPATSTPQETWVAVRSGADVVSLMPVDGQGKFEVSIEPGFYEVHAFSFGHAPSAAKSVDLSSGPGANSIVTLSVPLAARITSTVTDQDGAAVPARVTFFAQGTTPLPTVDARMRVAPEFGRGAGAVAYVTDGPETVVLPPGDYLAVASRGFSYEMDTQNVTVRAGDTTQMAFTVRKVIDTSGYVSSDFHIHGFYSPDSDVPWDIRAKQAATEDIDVPVLTEHVMAGGLQTTADALNLGDVVVGISGQEVTTFAYGHFNAFPLLWDPKAINMGAIFEHGRTPAELFDDMRAQQPLDEIIQVNHPRALGPGGYFDWIGLDAQGDTVSRTADWSLNWDAIEVWNGGCAGSSNEETYRDWIGLTNNGHKKALASGSDTHSEGRPIGMPRNWIEVDKALLAADSQNIVAPVRERKLFVSCGPFVRFSASDGTGMGGMTGVNGAGEVTFDVHVQATSFMQLEEVRLLENGVPVQSANISAESAVVRFDGSFTVTPAADAWYSVEVLGSGGIDPVAWGGPPNAFTNPIEVDADGDGIWTPPL